MRPVCARSLLAVLLALVLVAPASGEDSYLSRLLELEQSFAPRYMKLAKTAKRYRYPELTQRIFDRAEMLDPGSDEVIDFDPTVSRPASSSHRKRKAKLEREFEQLVLAEAKARMSLARWCDGNALLDEAVDQAAQAFDLAAAPVRFDAEGVISSAAHGSITKSLSLSLLEDREVFRGALVLRDSLPDSIPWDYAWSLATEHFHIVTNVSGDLCRDLGRALQAAREVYREETGYEVGARITVHVPATRKSYIDLWVSRDRPRPEPTNLGRCYRDFCGVDGSKGHREVLSVAIHEVAHGYLNLGLSKASGKRNAAMPPWYQEGLATYCAGYGRNSYSFERGIVDPELAKKPPLRRFRELLEKGEVTPLVDFLGQESAGTEYYLQACAFYWFFKETPDVDLRQRYQAAVRAMKRAKLGEDRIERGRKVFLKEIGIPVAELERRFFAWAKPSPQ